MPDELCLPSNCITPVRKARWESKANPIVNVNYQIQAGDGRGAWHYLSGVNCLHQQSDGAQGRRAWGSALQRCLWRSVCFPLVFVIVGLSCHSIVDSRSRSPFRIVALTFTACIECDSLSEFRQCPGQQTQGSHIYLR